MTCSQHKQRLWGTPRIWILWLGLCPGIWYLLVQEAWQGQWWLDPRYPVLETVELWPCNHSTLMRARMYSSCIRKRAVLAYVYTSNSRICIYIELSHNKSSWILPTLSGPVTWTFANMNASCKTRYCLVKGDSLGGQLVSGLWNSGKIPVYSYPKWLENVWVAVRKPFLIKNIRA